MKNATQAQYVQSFKISQLIAKSNKSIAETEKFISEWKQFKSDVNTLIEKIDEYKAGYEAGLQEDWFTGNNDNAWLTAKY